MKKFVYFMVFAAVIVAIFIVVALTNRPVGQRDATLGVPRVYEGWTVEQEQVFDSLRTVTSSAVKLFDCLKVSRARMDSIVKYWVNTELSIRGKKPLPKDCFIVYELLDFDTNGVKVLDRTGKWRYAMTYGMEPVAHIFLAGQNPKNKPYLDYFLRCLNGFGQLKDPNIKIKVVESVPKIVNNREILLGTIDEHTYPCNIVPQVSVWINFAIAHKLSSCFQDENEIWRVCSPNDLDSKCRSGRKIAINFPYKTQVMVFNDSSDNTDYIFVRMPGRKDQLLCER